MKKLNGLKESKKERRRLNNKNWENIELKKVEFPLKKSHKWKYLGLDKLPNFWLSILTSTHKVLPHIHNHRT